MSRTHQLIIAEKPSQAKAYANALGAVVRENGYYEGNDYLVTWCIGHLVELANADVYDERYKKWNIADLPIIPQKWEYVITPDKKQQFKIIKALMNDCRVSEVVIATDAGREGQLIGQLVCNQAGCKLPIKRAWLSSMETTAIVTAFANLRDGSEFDNLYQSALCRSQADWLCGINFSRAYTKLYNRKLAVGRVQTPTLAMIVERGAAISNFTKEKYFNVHLNNMGLISQIKSQTEAERVKSECDGKTATVCSVKREKKSVNSPKLYDLTTLQREANRLYGFTAQQTLDYTQSLYEGRLVSYPRTDSQYLTSDMAGTATEVIAAVVEVIPCFKGLLYTPDIQRVINNKLITDHYGIIPTVEIKSADLDELPAGERKILELITNKLLCATADKHEYEAVTAVMECNGFSFTAKGKIVINAGWKEIERLFKGKDEDEKTEITLDLAEGQELTAACNITEHFTQPPKAFTEDSLLSAMQNAGVDDVTEDVERSGLGTPATRAAIIEKLIKSGFVKRDKKNLVATAEGAELVSLMPDSVKSAKMTAEWENALSLIAKGEFPADYFMTKIGQFTNEIISQAKENVKPEFVAKSEKEVIGKCPRCNNSIVVTPKAYSCNSDCGFILWKSSKFFESAKKEFTKEIATALVNNGEVALDGLYSQKTGKNYSAIVCLDDTGKYVNFRLEFLKKRK